MKRYYFGWFLTEFDPESFDNLAKELSFLDNVQIEYLHFTSDSLENFIYAFNFDYFFFIPKNSTECLPDDANHVVFWVGGKKLLEFWMRKRIITNMKQGIFYDNLNKEDIKKIERLLLRRNWFNIRKYFALLLITIVAGLILMMAGIVSFPSLIILAFLWTISFYLMNIYNKIRSRSY